MKIYTYADGRLHPASKQFIKQQLGYTECQACNIEFSSLPQHKIHIHHIDHDHTNQDLSNLTMLCFHCHMKHHKTGNTYNKDRKFPDLHRFNEVEKLKIYKLWKSKIITVSKLAEQLECGKNTIFRILDKYANKHERQERTAALLSIAASKTNRSKQ